MKRARNISRVNTRVIGTNSFSIVSFETRKTLVPDDRDSIGGSRNATERFVRFFAILPSFVLVARQFGKVGKQTSIHVSRGIYPIAGSNGFHGTLACRTLPRRYKINYLRQRVGSLVINIEPRLTYPTGVHLGNVLAAVVPS